KSVRKMKLTRFYLRQNIEPLGSLCICIGSLPPGLFPPGSQPLLVLVNSKSGGGQGADMFTAFQRLLNPNQVYSLLEGGHYQVYAFRSISDFRVLICGGDGTVGWVLTCLDDVVQEMKCKLPASAVLPLGIGNDLSRVLHWGGGYSGG
ncbi:hypothetical protein pdam_00024626, partial [Pocillopora damicornis]